MQRPILTTILVALTCWAPAFAELEAGVAEVDVTPPVGSQMYGYGARGTDVSEGVHDNLFAKALVLEDGETRLAVVTLDLGSFPEENTDNVRALVREETEIDKVLLVASHTHSAPRFDETFPSEDKPWIRDAEEAIASAILRAANGTEPVNIGVGWGRVEEGHNRRKIVDGKAIMFWENRERVPTSPVDYQLGVIRVENEDGEPLATLINYACHPVVLGPENLQFSADYVGYMTEKVEENLGGQCMFLQGAAGDINPFWDKTPPSEGAFEQAGKMGHAIADEVIRVSNRIDAEYTDAALSIRTEIVPLATRRDRGRDSMDIMAEINTVLIGDEIALATFPGEFFVEHGLDLKERSVFEHTFFVGYTNQALGYFPTIQSTTEGGYGAASATRVEVGAGEKLVNRALINLYYQANLIQP